MTDDKPSLRVFCGEVLAYAVKWGNAWICSRCGGRVRVVT